MQTLKKIQALLTLPERKRAYLLIAMSMVTALLEMLGVASILPFIAVLANPELVQTNGALNIAFIISSEIGVRTTQEFLFFLGILVFVLLVFSLVFKAIMTHAQVRFALMREYSMGKRLFEGYLRQPYSWFLHRHSADLGKSILSEVGAVVDNAIQPMMVLIAQSIVALGLLALLILVDPMMALVMGTTLGLSYAGTFVVLNRWLKRLGQARIEANRERFTAVSESLGAIKEVKVGGLERACVERFAKPAKIFANGQATANVIGQLPRYALEAVAFGGILLLILYLMTKSGSFTAALPIIALYAFAGYRLMPALQQIYSALTRLRFAGPSLDALNQDLISSQTADIQEGHLSQLNLSQAIKFEQVCYSYPKSASIALKNINATIPVNSSVGFVGATGSGKTTMVDVILGLLEAQEGRLTVDGQPITSGNCGQWQRSIGYVPQHIYLTDDSIVANIAFGVNAEEINHQNVEHAAKIANLHEFIVNNFPQGYETKVGERGTRLSGGQRQRIGIARALYHKPRVLILDEATAALDKLTERAVMEAIKTSSREVTIIMIAHQLSTVRQCDQILLLDRGEIKARGTFEELTKTSECFRAMVNSN